MRCADCVLPPCCCFLNGYRRCASPLAIAENAAPPFGAGPGPGMASKLANKKDPDAIKKAVKCDMCKDLKGGAACVRACPTKATWKRESDGIVFMDFHRCIGCRFCMAACPFGARSFNYRDPRPFIAETNNEFPTRMKGVVEKSLSSIAHRALWEFFQFPALVSKAAPSVVLQF